MSVLDLCSTAASSLAARPVRSLLMSVGPLLGVAVVVGALGVSTSARAELRAALDALGSDLVLVEAGDSAGRLPGESVERAGRVPGVEGVSGLSDVEQLQVAGRRGAADGGGGMLRVLATDPSLAAVASLRLDWGRFISAGDVDRSRPVAVLGSRSARVLGVLPGEPRTVLLGDQLYGVVGVLEPVALLPELDTGVLVSPESAAQFGHDLRPTTLVLRAAPGTTASVSQRLDVAITFGVGAPVQVRVPTDLLAARAEIDRTLRLVVLAMGGLAMAIGGLGIANVMTIAVLQRTSEIGLRRALGHRRAAVGGQFLLESAAIGLLGAVLGAGLGLAFVAAIAARHGWRFDVEPAAVAGAATLAVVIALLAGTYPASKATRVDPATALRGS